MRPIEPARTPLTNVLSRFRETAPWSLSGNLARAIWLHAAERKRPTMAPRAERVVVSLTTVPSRVSKLLPALRSLLDQTCPADRILLCWPDRSRRSGVPYGRPINLPQGVELLPCEDSGPATKLLPTLKAEPDATIVVVDDDVVYPSDFLETLLAFHRCKPDAALGWRGWRFRDGTNPGGFEHIYATGVREPSAVDVLLGTWGYLLPAGALCNAVHDFDGYPDAVRWVDDVWISGHLALRGVPRYVVPARSLPIETRAAKVDALSSGPNRSGLNDHLAAEAFSTCW